MELPNDFNYVVDCEQGKLDDPSGSQRSDFAQTPFDIQLSSFQSSKLNLPTSFEESFAMTTTETRSDQESNGNVYVDEANIALNDNSSGGKMLGSGGVTGCGADSMAAYTPVSSVKEQNSENIDFGESVALDDFGGDFDESGCAIDTLPPASDIFADETGRMNLSDARSNESCEKATSECPTIDSAVAETNPLEEESLCPPSLVREKVSNTDEEEFEHGNSAGAEKDLNLEDEVSERKSEGSESGKASEKVLQKKVRQQTSQDSNRESNADLNVNSRPRRSIARKSVFELLQVEYRCSGGSRKHGINLADGEDASPVEGSRRKSQSKKKKQTVDHLDDDGVDKTTHEDHNTSKVVSYAPDDFLADGHMDSSVQKHDEESNCVRWDVPIRVKASKINGPKLARSHVTSIQPESCNQTTFAAEFEEASADVLSQSRSGEENLKSEADLMAENCKLRERLKALLQNNNSVVKKFKIDLHSRKFSRIRPPTMGSTPDRRTPGKWDSLTSSDSVKTIECDDAEEAWKSRSALLDRREHKLRELTAELDERACAIKISEGSLLRRERKLAELEKTLEYRERVLSRHEQNVQKRELALELTGSAELGAEETSGEPTALITEFQKRLDLRRQELDRRQNFLDTEREKLVSRERLVERQEQELQLKLQGNGSSDGNSVQESDEEEDVTGIKPLPSKAAKVNKRNEPMNQSSAKKAKMSASRDTPMSVKKLSKKSHAPGLTSAHNQPVSIASKRLSVSSSNSNSKKQDYKLRKRSI